VIGQPEPACLLIADISGYTGYLAGVELDHAQDILADLVSTVVGSLRPTFRLAKLEGDAAFAYVIAPLIDGSLLQDTVETMYFAFRRRLRDIGSASRCECNACIRIPTLGLKVVVHHGTVIRQRIAGSEELLGADVILVHRLLKNDVVETTGIAAYALYTAACAAAMGIEDPGRQGFRRHELETDVAGTVVGWLRDLHAAWDAEQARTRVVVEGRKVLKQYTFDTPAPPQVVWEYLTSPLRRPQWNADAVIEDSATGRRGSGTVNHCIHGRDAVVEEILDYRPYDWITVRSQWPIPGTPKVLISQVLTAGLDDGTHVELRVGATKPKDGPAIAALEPVFDQVVAHNFATIGPLLEAEAAARAAARDEEAALPMAAGRFLSEPVTAA